MSPDCHRVSLRDGDSTPRQELAGDGLRGCRPGHWRERRVSRTLPGTPDQKRPPKAARDLEARLWPRWVPASTARLESPSRSSWNSGWRRSVRICRRRRCTATAATSTVSSSRGSALCGSTSSRRLSSTGCTARCGSPEARAAARSRRRRCAKRTRFFDERSCRRSGGGGSQRNPAALASPPKLKRHEIRPPSAADVDRVLHAAYEESAELGLAVWLAAVTGARRGELCGIQWSDIDLDDRQRRDPSLGGRDLAPAHREGSEDAPGASDRARRRDCGSAAASDELTQAETALACGAGLDGDAYVLSEDAAGRAPLHPNLLSDRFRRLVRALNINCRLHDLRHWHVTQALGAGLPVRDVAERVGHASTRMTLDVYGHAIAESDRKTAEVSGGAAHATGPRDFVDPRVVRTGPGERNRGSSMARSSADPGPSHLTLDLGHHGARSGPSPGGSGTRGNAVRSRSRFDGALACVDRHGLAEHAAHRLRGRVRRRRWRLRVRGALRRVRRARR